MPEAPLAVLLLMNAATAYRYLLEREMSAFGNGTALFVMLNPSTADALTDDPTIRRCRGFADRWGYRRLRVVNLYAARATDPSDLAALDDPIGPDNYPTVVRELKDASLVIAAWGASEPFRDTRRPRAVFNRLEDELGGHTVEWFCLGVTMYGAPRHPLYVRGTQDALRWDPKGWRA